MIFLETSNKLNQQEIANVERELDIKFPFAFLKHYLENNGGYPELDNYVWKDKSSTTINTFFSIKYPGFNSLEDTYKELILNEKYLPIGILPFAVDDGGNYFCISSRKIDFGKIYYVNNDHHNINAVNDSLILINESFEDFLSQLS